jgi:hypothetical protein
LKHDSWKTRVARVAALRARASYREEKQRVVAELAEARRRGEDPAAHLAKLEADALRDELLGRQR